MIRRWTGGSGRSASASTDKPRQPHTACLADAGFGTIEEHRFEVGHVWNLGSFIGYLYSTSIVAAIVRTGAAAAFEADLRTALLALDPAGQYRETLRFSAILARPLRAKRRALSVRG